MPEHLEESSSQDGEPYLTIRPVASDDFRQSLRTQILETALVPEKIQPRKQIISGWLNSSKKLLVANLSAAIFIVIILSIYVASSTPAWSKIRQGLQRFFSVSPLTVSTSTTQFWSEVPPQEFTKTVATAYTNSLTTTEQLTQPAPPPGYATVAEFILATYPVKNYYSITELQAHLPLEIVRQEPYYDGTLYILRFPGGFLISYAEFTGAVGGAPAHIQSFR